MKAVSSYLVLFFLLSCQQNKYVSAERGTSFILINEKSIKSFQSLPPKQIEHYKNAFNKIIVARDIMSRRPKLFHEAIQDCKEVRVIDITDYTEWGEVISYILFDDELVKFKFDLPKSEFAKFSNCEIAEHEFDSEHFFVMKSIIQGKEKIVIDFDQTMSFRSLIE